VQLGLPSPALPQRPGFLPRFRICRLHTPPASGCDGAAVVFTQLLHFPGALLTIHALNPASFPNTYLTSARPISVQRPVFFPDRALAGMARTGGHDSVSRHIRCKINDEQ
jgi:hypothetical protein